MNAREFYDLTKAMRVAQKNFFAAKDKQEKQNWLIKSKSFELRIDEEIARVDAILIQRANQQQKSKDYGRKEEKGGNNR